MKIPHLNKKLIKIKKAEYSANPTFGYFLFFWLKKFQPICRIISNKNPSPLSHALSFVNDVETVEMVPELLGRASCEDPDHQLRIDLGIWGYCCSIRHSFHCQESSPSFCTCSSKKTPNLYLYGIDFFAIQTFVAF